MDIERKMKNEWLELWKQPPGAVVVLADEEEDLFLVTDMLEPTDSTNRGTRRFVDNEADCDILCVDLATGDLCCFRGCSSSRVVKATLVAE